ncbi:uncharacterized protein N7483_012752 [Penicillium malachiteum]|uniref:uncharacterized protein n=1 Tax=Penicillium malachiteum TaxID=1324776 RepID=UPI00254783A9|nr:uncharacterized protein N7483_012752 [Penicillium malachiteum]KAJ5715571.1 hypothetical protein N7483_012752 [Penicillium malachiteum]
MDTLMRSLPSQLADFVINHQSLLEIVSMFSIGAYNAIEVGISTFNYFTRYRGTYFWSMQVASWGILLQALSAQVHYLTHVPALPLCIFFIIGWYGMVTGQAMVLYSRLQLVVPDRSAVRCVLGMIITNAIILHIPMTVLFFGVNLGDERFHRAAHIYDRIQLTGFCIQDLIICGIYSNQARRSLKPVIPARGRDGQRVLTHLILVNILVVLMDLALVFVEFKAHYLEVSIRTVIYSIKLKLEFGVLTRLRSLTRTQPCVCTNDPGSPRRSSDINIFDIMRAKSRVSPDIEAPSLFVDPDSTQRRRSLRSGTYDFHQALRDTASTENMVSPAHSRVRSCLTSDITEGRPRIGSADTRCAVETVLSKSIK